MAEPDITSTSSGPLDWSLSQERPFSSRREIARRHAVNMVMLIYLAIIFEGVFRKYLFPEIQRPLIFMRDPVVIYLYFFALRHGFVKNSLFLVFGIGLFFAAVLVTLLHDIGGTDSFIIMGFGFRQYFLLIPLPFVMASVLSHDDFLRFYRMNMIIIILMAPFMVLQVLAPPDSWLNTGRALDENLAFSNNMYGDFVRVAGFFTSSYGLNSLLPLDAAILLLVQMMPRRERPCSPALYLGAAFALMVAISVSGDRGAIVGLVIVGIAACFLPFLMPTRPAALRGAIATPVIGLLAFAVFTLLFPDQFAALRDRWIGANYGAGEFQIVDRAIGDLSDFTDVLSRIPALGFGIGTGSNAGNILGGFIPDMLRVQTENDWARHIADLGPALGILYIIFRVALTTRLGLAGMYRAMRRGDATAWLLFAAAGPGVFNGTITGQSTAGGFAWFSVGLILAMPKKVAPLR